MNQQTQMETASLSARTSLEQSERSISAAQVAKEPGGKQNDILAASLNGFRVAIEKLNKPKTIVRGPDGRAQGIE